MKRNKFSDTPVEMSRDLLFDRITEDFTHWCDVARKQQGAMTPEIAIAAAILTAISVLK